MTASWQQATGVVNRVFCLWDGTCGAGEIVVIGIEVGHGGAEGQALRRLPAAINLYALTDGCPCVTDPKQIAHQRTGLQVVVF